METLTWKSLVIAALRNKEAHEARAFAEDRLEDHMREIGRLEAQMMLVSHYESAEELLAALDRLRNRIAFELQTSGDHAPGSPGWTREAVGMSPNGRSPRPLEYPDGLPPPSRRHSRNR